MFYEIVLMQSEKQILDRAPLSEKIFLLVVKNRICAKKSEYDQNLP